MTKEPSAARLWSPEHLKVAHEAHRLAETFFDGGIRRPARGQMAKLLAKHFANPADVDALVAAADRASLEPTPANIFALRTALKPFDTDQEASDAK